LRVVIAEDEPIIRMDIKRMLEELGYQVLGEYRDGEAAVKLTGIRFQSLRSIV